MTNFPTKEVEIARNTVQRALQYNRHQLLEPEAMALTEPFGITGVRHRVALTIADAVHASEDIGFPVVLKVISPDISHKTDVGGVKVGIKDKEGVRAAYDDIMENVRKKQPGARIYGMLVCEMATPSTEVIIGGLRDPQFGPAVMFGLGGIFVEIFKDVSFRIVPVEEYEALDMIYDVKGSKILQGFRGGEALDIPALVQAIKHVSDIMMFVDQIREIDLNPVLVYQKGIKTVDARVILNQVS